MKPPLTIRDSTFPVVLMVGFTGLLIVALAVRVYYADHDLAMDRITRMQAALAAEGGIHSALQKMQAAVTSALPTPDTDTELLRLFTEVVPQGTWARTGLRGEAFWRITQIKKIPELDRPETPLVDESSLFQVVSEGRAGRHSFRTTAVLGATQLVRQFAVFNSLNGHYYGQPLQGAIANAGGLDRFVQANQEPFASGDLTTKGVCHSPTLLYKMFDPEGKDPFQTLTGTAPLAGNYGRSWRRDGESPAHGPLYCQTPVVIDTHTFWGPVQTASFLYRRLNGLPKIQTQDAVLALHSSRRVQLATDNREGENPSDWFLDQDSQSHTSFIQPWRPDFAALRAFAKAQGIYVDRDGKGFLGGEAHPVDYHFGSHKEYSETYFTPTSTHLEQDTEEANHIVLSTAPKFEERNNLDSGNLKKARILFSENSIYLRGEIGGDLVIVSPKHIFLTGSVNPDAHFHVFLIAGEGVALSTNDLEKVVLDRQEGPEFIKAASTWLINAVLYKPGGGWYGSWSKPAETASIVEPVGMSARYPLRVQVSGACLEGDLQRWIRFADKDGVQVQWQKTGIDRLPVVPYSVNLVRLKTLPSD